MATISQYLENAGFSFDEHGNACPPAPGVQTPLIGMLSIDEIEIVQDVRDQKLYLLEPFDDPDPLLVEISARQFSEIVNDIGHPLQ